MGKSTINGHYPLVSYWIEFFSYPDDRGYSCPLARPGQAQNNGYGGDPAETFVQGVAVRFV